MFHLPGFGNRVEFRVHNSSIVNLERAVKERVFNVTSNGEFVTPPRPDKTLFNKRMASFLKALKKFLPTSTPVSYDEFVGLYKDRRKKIYQSAVDSLLVKEVSRKDAMIRCFVKAEKINFTAKVDPAPRLIQPREPRYNVEVGRYLKPIEHMVYGAIAKVFGSTTVVKGLNADDSGRLLKEKWDSYKDPVAIGLDASRFDQHVSKTALQWEHKVYLHVFKGCPFLRKLLSWQIVNHGVGYTRDGRLKYSVEGCRMSGDMNTALGNCVLMCGLVHSYLTERGIVKFDLVNNGDDCVVIVEKCDLERLQSGLTEWFIEMGFNMKVETPVYELEHIDFCQTRPIWTPDGWRMVRDPRIAIAKDCVSIHPLDTEGGFRKYLDVFSTGGLHLTSGIPMWQSFYKKLNQVSGGKTGSKIRLETGMSYLSNGMKQLEQPVHPRTRYSFWRAFDIIPDYQVALENEFAKATLNWKQPKEESGEFHLRCFA